MSILGVYMQLKILKRAERVQKISNQMKNDWEQKKKKKLPTYPACKLDIQLPTSTQTLKVNQVNNPSFPCVLYTLFLSTDGSRFLGSQLDLNIVDIYCRLGSTLKTTFFVFNSTAHIMITKRLLRFALGPSFLDSDYKRENAPIPYKLRIEQLVKNQNQILKLSEAKGKFKSASHRTSSHNQAARSINVRQYPLLAEMRDQVHLPYSATILMFYNVTTRLKFRISVSTSYRLICY